MPSEILLERARKTAAAIIERLKPHCKRIEVAGSIRRQRPRVHDINLVLIPSDPWNLHHSILGLCRPFPAKASGSKIMRIQVNGIQVDLYFADETTWATLLLIRTGSAENNIRLCSIAKKKGWHLHADGSGLFNENGERIAGDTEAGIYEALGIPYQDPTKRN